MNPRLPNSAVASRTAASSNGQEPGAAAAGADTRSSALCLALLIAALWLATRPYLGVIHDSRFYAVQALNALQPGRFADDLYFRYGSQDQFTLFTLAYKPVLAALGLSSANIILTVLGQCFWVAGLIYLARAIFRDSWLALIAVALAIALPGGVFFTYGEQFLTPRLFAEALTFWALGSMLRGRPVLAILLLGLSATVHPLMTLPGLVVLFLHEAAGRRVWWALGALAVIASLGLASAGVQPFARLLESFDPAWFAVVRVRDFFCLLTQWTFIDWLRLANMFVLAAFGLTVAEPRERRFLVVVLIVALGGLALTLIGGDLLRNVLVVDIQQYRATWLLALVANLFVAPLLLRIRWRNTSSLTRGAFVFAGSMLIVAAFVGGGGGYIFATPIVLLAGLAVTWERSRQLPISGPVQLFGLIMLGLICGVTLAALYAYIVYLKDWPSLFWQTTRGFGLTVAALAAVAIRVTASADARPAVTRALILFATCLAGLAALSWDQRTPWTRFVETVGAAPESLSALLPGQKPVYWEGDVRVPWFVLHRPSYFSCAQGTGALFFRGTAINYQHRYETFEQLRTFDFAQELACPLPPGPDTASFTREALVSVCEREPELGALVLTRPVANVPQLVWDSPVRFEDVRPIGGKLRVFTTDRFFVVSCADVR